MFQARGSKEHWFKKYKTQRSCRHLHCRSLNQMAIVSEGIVQAVKQIVQVVV
jgi:hypothetical protein